MSPLPTGLFFLVLTLVSGIIAPNTPPKHDVLSFVYESGEVKLSLPDTRTDLSKGGDNDGEKVRKLLADTLHRVLSNPKTENMRAVSRSIEALLQPAGLSIATVEVVLLDPPQAVLSQRAESLKAQLIEQMRADPGVQHIDDVPEGPYVSYPAANRGVVHVRDGSANGIGMVDVQGGAGGGCLALSEEITLRQMKEQTRGDGGEGRYYYGTFHRELPLNLVHYAYYVLDILRHLHHKSPGIFSCA